MRFDQSDFDIRCEWGGQGVSRLAPLSDAIIIVDCLSFSTRVTVAVARGAIIRHLAGTLSPEARLAADAFHGAAADLLNRLQSCSSGQELLARGFEEDLAVTAQLDVEDCALVLKDGAYIKAAEGCPR